MAALSTVAESSVCLIDRLPNELLALIRGVYPASDLIYQVRFCQVSERTAAFSSSNDDFWWQLCRANGLGSLHNEDRVDWKQVAFDCERHARVCEHPGCRVRFRTKLAASKPLKAFQKRMISSHLHASAM